MKKLLLILFIPETGVHIGKWITYHLDGKIVFYTLKCNTLNQRYEKYP
jgi:hypothetical protein